MISVAVKYWQFERGVNHHYLITCIILQKSQQYIPIHQLSVLLGPDTSRVLPMLHAFAGCDSTSQFVGIGKKTAWKIRKDFPDLTKTLLAINNDPNSFSIESEHMALLERFVVPL